MLSRSLLFRYGVSFMRRSLVQSANADKSDVSIKAFKNQDDKGGTGNKSLPLIPCAVLGAIAVKKCDEEEVSEAIHSCKTFTRLFRNFFLLTLVNCYGP